MADQTNNAQSKETALDDLAHDLAFNMIDHATHGYDKAPYGDALKLLLDAEKEARLQTDHPYGKFVRNVLIIGAGASRDACQNVPVAEGLVMGLKNIISDNDTLPKKRKQYFENILTLDGQFANAMQIYVEMVDDLDLREKIKEELNYKYETSLFYEIVAHMFKHKLIDVIINYNFDEILDNVLDDEMGKTQYCKVFLNGHVPNYDDLLFRKTKRVDEMDKLAVPLYIKPHGTVSYPETFQYTDAHYRRNGPNKINRLIEDVINGAYKNSGKGKIPLNIISAGYAYKDLDLANMLYAIVKEKDRKIKFFTFDWKGQDDFKESSTFFKEILKCHDEGHDHFWVYDPQQDNSEKKPGGVADFLNLGDAFKQLWEKTCGIFKLEERPRDITRHEFIAKLFGGRKIKDIEAYFECRIYVELAILIAKADGDILHMSQIEESKVKKYFNLYYNYRERGGDNLSSKKSLREFIEVFMPKILKPYMGFSDTYEIDQLRWQDNDRKEVINEIFDVFFNAFNDNLPYEDTGNIRELEAESRETFNNVSDRKLLYVVNSDISQYNISPFNGLGMKNYLYSDMRWRLKSLELLGRKEWNVMLNISENGKIVKDFNKWPQKNWQVDEHGTPVKRVIYTITADYTQLSIDPPPQTLIDSSNNYVEHVNLMLPWEIHNKHMSLFLNVKKNGDADFIGGIYYTRRLLTNVVNPIYVGLDTKVKPEYINLSESKTNGNILFDFFCNYWLKARIYSGEKLGLKPPNMASLKLTEKDYHSNKLELIEMIYYALYKSK